MGGSADITLIAFDMYGTLARNDASSWEGTFRALALEQGLAVSGEALRTQWSTRDVRFRASRTNMEDPEASPPFRSYWEAWRDTFVDSFAALGIEGDAALAATRCVDALCERPAFSDVTPVLEALAATRELAVLSNADDRYLDGTIRHNGWRFATVVSSESARAYKPDPRIFATFCREAGVAPERVLYVGDSPYDDVHGAKLAGMQAVLLLRDQQTPGRTPPPDATVLLAADHEIDSLTALLPLVQAAA
ncbi:MAG: HAD-IA family hydrolase [Chloroflexi bacterium]|nr:HAD-IA family hydrolase [Chloroflexota bacterium]